MAEPKMSRAAAAAVYYEGCGKGNTVNICDDLAPAVGVKLDLGPQEPQDGDVAVLERPRKRPSGISLDVYVKLLCLQKLAEIVQGTSLAYDPEILVAWWRELRQMSPDLGGHSWPREMPRAVKAIVDAVVELYYAQLPGDKVRDLDGLETELKRLMYKHLEAVHPLPGTA